MKLSAKSIQHLLAVPDGKVIAYGYTLERHTLVVWFANGMLFRRESLGLEEMVTESSKHFEPDYFKKNVKRWYLGWKEIESTYSIHPRLLDLFEAFGNPLTTIEGGKYPPTIAMPVENESRET